MLLFNRWYIWDIISKILFLGNTFKSIFSETIEPIQLKFWGMTKDPKGNRLVWSKCKKSKKGQRVYLFLNFKVNYLQNYWSDFTQILCVMFWRYDLYDAIKIFEYVKIFKIRSTYDIILTYLQSCDVKKDGTLPKGLGKTNKMVFVSCLYLN